MWQGERGFGRALFFMEIEAIRNRDTPSEAVDYRSAVVVACVLCGLLTIVSLCVPVGIAPDPGWGWLEWRTLVNSGPVNTIVAPDPTDISKDRSEFMTWWSPGQHLIPGVFIALGLSIGSALSVTAGVSLLSCLIGWIRVFKRFRVSSKAATFAVVLLTIFRYSTLPFGIYNGGEILLQGVTPWLILAGCNVPAGTGFRSAFYAGLALLGGFFAKLTGVLVGGAALGAGVIVALTRLRRVTNGMAAGAAGALASAGLLNAVWFSRGITPASGTGWSFGTTRFVFAFAAPWGAGVSWMDMLAWLFLNPQRPIFRDSAVIVWLLIPAAIFFTAVLFLGARQVDGRLELRELVRFTLCFYAICAATMAVLYSHGGSISLDERHLRSAGTLIFVCAIAVADRLPRRSMLRLAVAAFCTLMSLYGLSSFVNRVRMARPHEVDSYSRTRQVIVDRDALEYARAAFAREKRDALFVLPSPDVAAALPPQARILSTFMDFASETTVASARRTAGRVPGHVYVLMQTQEAQSALAISLLNGFADYPPNTWERHQFGSTTVWVQPATVPGYQRP
ncbi:MAG TPA: hypothetical protein VGN17_09370 [Bryobacteraceae bacterium]|jgi:hypothetical protein